MIKWYPTLYIDQVTEKKERKIKKRMERRKVNVQVYCVAIASNEKNLFDIYHANELLFPYSQRKEIKIVGLAGSKESAVLMVADIVNDMYQQTGKIDAGTFFQWEENVSDRR